MKLSKTTRAWHLVLLTCFAIAQPLFDLLGRSPEFFVIHRASAVQIILLAIAALAVLPLALFAIEFCATCLSKRLGVAAHNVFVFLLVLIISLPPLMKVFGNVGSPWLYTSAIALSIVLSIGYCRTSLVRSFLLFLSPAILIFPVLFFFNAKVFEMIFGQAVQLGRATGISKDVPVVLVIFDEFPLNTLLDRTGNVDSIRFPGFGALAGTGTWYRNGTTVTSWTERAVPVILSGMNPDIKITQLPSLAYYPQNIFTLLSDSHDLRAYEQVTHLCPDNLCTEAANRESFLDGLKSLLSDSVVVTLHVILPQELKKGLPEIAFAWGDFWGKGGQKRPKKQSKTSKKGLLQKGDWADDLWLFDKFLGAIRARERAREAQPTAKPGFYMIHITFPHVPYRYLPSGKKYLRDIDRRNDKGFKRQWGQDEWPTVQALQRFLMQASVADRLVAELIAVLKENGIFDKSLVVVTADHGTSFQTGEFSRRASDNSALDVLPVPFFIKYPEQASPTISRRNVETPDILPTILDVLGLSPSTPLDGSSALSTQPDRPEKIYYLLENGIAAGPTVSRFPKEISLEHGYARIHEHFSNGSLEHLYEIGPALSFRGLALEEALTKGAQVVQFSINNVEEFNKVDLMSDFVPAFVAGELHGANPSKQALGIVLNGRVAATTWSDISTPPNVKFSAMLPEASFKNGKNSISLVRLPG